MAALTRGEPDSTRTVLGAVPPSVSGEGQKLPGQVPLPAARCFPRLERRQEVPPGCGSALPSCRGPPYATLLSAVWSHCCRARTAGGAASAVQTSPKPGSISSHSHVSSPPAPPPHPPPPPRDLPWKLTGGAENPAV